MIIADVRPEEHTTALQLVPSIAAVVTWAAGLTIEKWLGIAGIVFILIQTVGYLWRWRRDIRRERERIREHAMAPDTDKADL